LQKPKRRASPPVLCNDAKYAATDRTEEKGWILWNQRSYFRGSAGSESADHKQNTERHVNPFLDLVPPTQFSHF